MSTTAHQRALDEALTEQRPPRRRISGFVEWSMVVLAIVAVAAVIGLLGVLFLERELGRRIYPNISVRGVAVGGLTLEQAQQALEDAYEPFLSNPIDIQYGGQSWQPKPKELGLRLVLDTALVDAFALGRSDTRVDNLRRAAAVWKQGYDLPLHVEIDQAVMQRYFQRLAATIETSPHDAALSLNGAQVMVEPEIWGTQALIDATLRDTTAALQSLTHQSISLRTRTMPPRLRDATIAPIAAQLQLMLSAPVILNGTTGACVKGCRWELTPAQIADWLSVRRVNGRDGAPTYTITLDRSGIRSALVPLAAAVRQEGGLPRVAWNGGDLRISVPGTTGLGLNAEQAISLVSAAISHDQRIVNLPMAPIPPPVTENNLATLRITEQLSLGLSSFAGSEQYRITNIRAGARRMNGLLIPPGGSFSFNTQLGPVNAANGFVEGLAIVNDRTQKEWGGGLCQVSTTVFRAAFFAGLPIDERHEHAFRISWYEELGEPAGLDAAIFTPYNDLRFTNDTDGWLLMESWADLAHQRLAVVLYGSPTGRTVNYSQRVIRATAAPARPVYIDDPTKPLGYFRKSDSARGGITVEIYRTVSAAGQIIAQNTFPTEFRPWPNIYVRGTGG